MVSETLSKTSALEMRVAELTLENEQELRAHTTNMNLKIKDLTEKFTAELEGDKARFETLAQSKNEQELQFETDLKSAEDVASSQAADTEQGYSRKMLAEVEREAKRRACCKVTLEVLSNNAPAKKAYTRFGFEPYVLDPEAGPAQFWQKAVA